MGIATCRARAVSPELASAATTLHPVIRAAIAQHAAKARVSPSPLLTVSVRDVIMMVLLILSAAPSTAGIESHGQSPAGMTDIVTRKRKLSSQCKARPFDMGRIDSISNENIGLSLQSSGYLDMSDLSEYRCCRAAWYTEGLKRRWTLSLGGDGSHGQAVPS